jgi:hypothetical protein
LLFTGFGRGRIDERTGAEGMIIRGYEPKDEDSVMGDVYPYYEEKLGYEIEGKIYIVKERAK